jgi:trehalose 6-phosphate phosphatase
MAGNLDAIVERVAVAASVVVISDFDGTLTPIVSHPDLVRLDARVRDMLQRFADRPGWLVALISGRALTDLRDKIRLPDVVCAGNHGFEIEGPGLSFTHPGAIQARPALHRFHATLVERFASVSGIRIENKELTLSIHWRHAAAGDRDAIMDETRRMLGAFPMLRLTLGKCVAEVRPNVPWDKGAAARWLLEQFAPEMLGPAAPPAKATPEPLVIILGDDRTDEDMFRALPHAVTMKVGDPSESAANYCLPSPEHVIRSLARLA